MSTHQGDTSRKPSGSSTRSSGHSPSASPGNAHSQRMLTPTTTNNMFGVGMSGTAALKNLNSSWQVWGSATPASKRNASISSATSVNDLSPSQGEHGYRANLGESWSAPRASSGTWDDMDGSPQKKDFSQLDPNSPLSLHHTKQRQATAAQAAALSNPRIDDRSSAKPGQFSPQRFDNGLGKDASGPNRYPASPTGPGTFGSTGFGHQNGGFDSMQVSSMVDNELSLGLRGMAVEDDHHGPQYRQPTAPQHNNLSSISPVALHGRAPPQMAQTRSSYAGFPQVDYTHYSNGAVRDPYSDYAYGYSGPADPSLYPTSTGMPNASPASLYPGVSPQAIHPNNTNGQQSGVYFDFSASARSPTQYYYPVQPMMYPTMSPMPTPQLSAALPAGMPDKKQVRFLLWFPFTVLMVNA
ncbi:hypothetical protein BV22DRAFT_368002 [Leucogyrophana mollusca]|uniref:Uncharacterized protein n=1 Tax=Leucogyrophana mollusca TaxID=85980 RepID=A0ACB8BMF0_9AGAM|nr:hypothetical protein BV22DRAFT_368002 [Leucogyrophana mollusca]